MEKGAGSLYGEHISRLMAEHNVDVSTVGQYEVRKLNSDYFDEE